MFSDASPARSVQIFSSYAQKDSKLLEELKKHLSLLIRLRLIKGWYHQNISPESNWQSSIDAYLHTSDIILLLISPDFIASDYCYSVEMQQALARSEAGKASVIPILLRPTFWQDLPFARLQSLPRSSREGVKAVTLRRNRDLAFVEIVADLKKIIDDFITRRAPSLSTTSTMTRETSSGPSRSTCAHSRSVNRHWGKTILQQLRLLPTWLISTWHKTPTHWPSHSTCEH